MANKFGLTYLLKCENSNGEIVDIEPPFSLQFSVQRSITGGANSAHFTVYNLAHWIRESLYKDQYKIDFKKVQLFAGYSENVLTPMVFNGNIRLCQSYRDGVNFLTELECYDGAFAMTEGKASIATVAGTAIKDSLKQLMNALPEIAGTTVGNGYDKENKRAQVLFGNPAEYLKVLSQNRFFIDNNHAYILADNEVLKGDVETIDASSGLLGTPKRNNTLIELETIFEPRIQVAQLLELVSTTNPAVNGLYKVLECQHSGMISETVSSSVTTQLKLLKETDGKFVLVQHGN